MKPKKTTQKASDFNRLNVPYPTVVSFRRALRVLSKPERELAVTRATLIKHRLPKSAVYPVLHALKFLGLIDHRHKARQSLYRFRDEPAQRELLIRKAYAPLIERLDLPVTSRQELIERMKPAIRSSDSVVPLAATFFMWAMGNTSEPVMLAGSVRTGPPPGRMLSNNSLPGERTPKPIRVNKDLPTAMIHFQIQVDSKTTQADIEKMIDDVRRACAKRTQT